MYPDCLSSSVHRADHCIPRVIHQTWKESKPPSEFALYHLSWTHMNPGWLLLMWTDDDVHQWLSANYEWFIPTFDAYEHPVMRADAFRYFVLHAYGGVYADLDYEAVQPLDSYLPNISHPLGFVAPGDWHSSISNSLMVTQYCPALWEPLLHRLVVTAKTSREGVWSLFPSSRVMSATGPTFLRMWFESERPEHICRLPRARFSPCDYCNPNCKTDGALTVHHYARSWNRWDTLALNTIVCQWPCWVTFVVLFLIVRTVRPVRGLLRRFAKSCGWLLAMEIIVALLLLPLPLLLVSMMPS